MSDLQLKWNLSDFEIKTKAVEQQLQPLIINVTTLMNSNKSVRKGRGKSKKAPVLVAAVERAIENFIKQGEQIAAENPTIGKQMLSAVGEVRSSGDIMSKTSRDFAENPCDSTRRAEMVKASRLLLAAVTRLLTLADMIDVQLLVNVWDATQASLERVKVAPKDQLIEELKHYQQVSRNLLLQSGRRQQELTDPQVKDDLAAARAVLKKSSAMLMCASTAYVAHSDVPAAKTNKDLVLRQICEAVNTIGDAMKGNQSGQGLAKLEKAGKVGTSLDQLEHSASLDYKEKRTRQLLEQQMEELLSGAMLISDSGSIKDERKNKILTGCNAVKDALQALLTISMKRGEGEKVDKAVDDVSRKAKDLHRQLRKAIADKVVDTFTGSGSPLLALINAAEKGDVQEVETCAAMFTEHCNKLIEVANQVCELSTNEDGIKMVRYAASQLATLCPEVINAARILSLHPKSAVVQDNMKVFRGEWENQVKILLEAVDDITTIDDILSVLDNQVNDDINQFVQALQEKNPKLLKTIAENIKGRAERVCGVASAEMDNYEPCPYTRQVLQAVRMLNGDVLKKFEQKTAEVVKIMEKNKDEEIDENEFIDATRLVYDGIRDVRRAVLMNRADEDLDPEEVTFEEPSYAMETLTRRPEVVVDEKSDQMSGITVARQAMTKLPEKEKTKLFEQVEQFQSEKRTFDREVAKWDESDNDIISLAKKMCIIMMNMTDFLRERGPLKTTNDIIYAAQRISALGTKLDQLGRQIGDTCPESSTKNDLFAYLERVALYCHQISIIARVKADVQNSAEELMMAGFENAFSLIETAKNLMNAVVLTVRASYVASTKYSRHTPIQSSIVVWKMKVPEKKPLVRMEKREVKAVIRKQSQRKPHQNVVKMMADFQIV